MKKINKYRNNKTREFVLDINGIGNVSNLNKTINSILKLLKNRNYDAKILMCDTWKKYTKDEMFLMEITGTGDISNDLKTKKAIIKIIEKYGFYGIQISRESTNIKIEYDYYAISQ